MVQLAAHSVTIRQTAIYCTCLGGGRGVFCTLSPCHFAGSVLLLWECRSGSPPAHGEKMSDLPLVTPPNFSKQTRACPTVSQL